MLITLKALLTKKWRLNVHYLYMTSSISQTMHYSHTDLLTSQTVQVSLGTKVVSIVVRNDLLTLNGTHSSLKVFILHMRTNTTNGVMTTSLSSKTWEIYKELVSNLVLSKQDDILYNVSVMTLTKLTGSTKHMLTYNYANQMYLLLLATMTCLRLKTTYMVCGVGLTVSLHKVVNQHLKNGNMLLNVTNFVSNGRRYRNNIKLCTSTQIISKAWLTLTKTTS